MSHINLSQIIHRVPLFQGLHENEFKTVLSYFRPYHVSSNLTIFSEGDPSHYLCVILAGEVDITSHKHGSLHRAQSGDIFGEIGLITQLTRSASAIAISDCTLLRIEHTEFNLLTGKQPRISSVLHRNICVQLAQHITRMNNAPLESRPTTASPKKHSSGITLTR